VQTTFNTQINTTIGIPTTMNINGIERTKYNSIDIWKFKEALPFLSTQSDVSFLDSQQIRGPRTLPRGKKLPAKAER
jgi:hypothetical protein